MIDRENPEDGRCDLCDSRVGNAHLSRPDVCESCLNRPSEVAALRGLLASVKVCRKCAVSIPMAGEFCSEHDAALSARESAVELPGLFPAMERVCLETRHLWEAPLGYTKCARCGARRARDGRGREE